jgi:hypothetical protein
MALNGELGLGIRDTFHCLQDILLGCYVGTGLVKLLLLNQASPISQIAAPPSTYTQPLPSSAQFSTRLTVIRKDRNTSGFKIKTPFPFSSHLLEAS